MLQTLIAKLPTKECLELADELKLQAKECLELADELKLQAKE